VSAGKTEAEHHRALSKGFHVKPVAARLLALAIDHAYAPFSAPTRPGRTTAHYLYMDHVTNDARDMYCIKEGPVLDSMLARDMDTNPAGEVAAVFVGNCRLELGMSLLASLGKAGGPIRNGGATVNNWFERRLRVVLVGTARREREFNAIAPGDLWTAIDQAYHILCAYNSLSQDVSVAYLSAILNNMPIVDLRALRTLGDADHAFVDDGGALAARAGAAAPDAAVDAQINALVPSAGPGVPFDLGEIGSMRAAVRRATFSNLLRAEERQVLLDSGSLYLERTTQATRRAITLAITLAANAANAVGGGAPIPGVAALQHNDIFRLRLLDGAGVAALSGPPGDGGAPTYNIIQDLGELRTCLTPGVLAGRDVFSVFVHHTQFQPGAPPPPPGGGAAAPPPPQFHHGLGAANILPAADDAMQRIAAGILAGTIAGPPAPIVPVPPAVALGQGWFRINNLAHVAHADLIVVECYTYATDACVPAAAWTPLVHEYPRFDETNWVDFVVLNEASHRFNVDSAFHSLYQAVLATGEPGTTRFLRPHGAVDDTNTIGISRGLCFLQAMCELTLASKAAERDAEGANRFLVSLGGAADLYRLADEFHLYHGGCRVTIDYPCCNGIWPVAYFMEPDHIEPYTPNVLFDRLRDPVQLTQAVMFTRAAHEQANVLMRTSDSCFNGYERRYEFLAAEQSSWLREHPEFEIGGAATTLGPTLRSVQRYLMGDALGSNILLTGVRYYPGYHVRAPRAAMAARLSLLLRTLIPVTLRIRALTALTGRGSANFVASPKLAAACAGCFWNYGVQLRAGKEFPANGLLPDPADELLLFVLATRARGLLPAATELVVRWSLKDQDPNSHLDISPLTSAVDDSVVRLDALFSPGLRIAASGVCIPPAAGAGPYANWAAVPAAAKYSPHVRDRAAGWLPALRNDGYNVAPNFAGPNFHRGRVGEIASVYHLKDADQYQATPAAARLSSMLVAASSDIKSEKERLAAEAALLQKEAPPPPPPDPMVSEPLDHPPAGLGNAGVHDARSNTLAALLEMMQHLSAEDQALLLTRATGPAKDAPTAAGDTEGAGAV
jgi:hypothetical protein